MAWALRKKKQEEVESRPAELPPFMAQAAVYRDRLRMMKAWTIGVTVVALALLAMQETRFHGALSKYTNREILIVPGAVDFMRVRPNTVPDNVVFYFAEYITESVGTFNYLNVEAKSRRLAEFFTPQFRERYLSDVKRNLNMYRELNVTEVLTPHPATRFDLVKDADGTPHYLVDVEARLDRFSGDNRLSTEDEVVTIRFRTSRIVPDKPWFFEVEDIKRQTADEFKHDKDARERLSK